MSPKTTNERVALIDKNLRLSRVLRNIELLLIRDDRVPMDVVSAVRKRVQRAIGDTSFSKGEFCARRHGQIRKP
jgi:hypothetical protein